MLRATPILLALLLVPAGASVAAPPALFEANHAVLVASSSPGNVYVAGGTTVVAAPVMGDLTALGGSVVTTAPVRGDALLFGGSIYSRATVGGDLRIAGGNISIDESVTDDLIALGASVRDVGRAGGNVFVAGANVTLANGAGGPVTIYGNTVSLSGVFDDDVNIVASGRIILAASTTIAGTFSYKAPNEATIPPSAIIRGGVEYTNASYLPDVGTSRILAAVSIAFFMLVRILGALILAGLFAGLFPRLAETMLTRATHMRTSKILLAALLGFAVCVVTPVLFLLLTLTFVGIGLALVTLVLYALVLLLASVYAGILCGGYFARRYANREHIFWHDGVLGMLALSVISLVPYIGTAFVFLLTMFTVGLLVITFFNFAFAQDEHADDESPEGA